MSKLFVYSAILFWNGMILSFAEGCGIIMPRYVPRDLRVFVSQSVWNDYRARQHRQLESNNLCRTNPQVCAVKISSAMKKYHSLRLELLDFFLRREARCNLTFRMTSSDLLKNPRRKLATCFKL